MQNPTETKEITVQYVNDPKPGKKWGSIKSSDGDYFFGPPAMLKLYQPGETCKIEFELGGKDGTLKSLHRKISTTPQVLAPKIPAAPRQRTNPADSEQIFTMCLVKERPVFKQHDATEIELIAEINKIRNVYRNTFGGNEKQRSDEMSDEIPY